MMCDCDLLTKICYSSRFHSKAEGVLQLLTSEAIFHIGDGADQGDVPRVDRRLAVSRAFGDKSLKKHLSSEPHVTVEKINDDAEFIILASDGLWKVMSNQEVVDCIKDIKDARSSAKRLTEEAVNRKNNDDISCIVVKLQ
ncbi:putative protein phosphatase 2C [Trifolium repens]|nr:putative protein phosphatase 2C [Trifolium repens]